MNSEIRELIYKKYIYPTESPRGRFIGIEIELPVVNIKGGATDHSVSQRAFHNACEHFGFIPHKYDDNGVCHEAVDEKTGDIFSFDCSYNNFEISFGKEKELTAIDKRFREYVLYINGFLKKYGHTLTGMGIQPYYSECLKEFVPSGRYKMLEGYLRKSEEWEGNFHKFPSFGTFASASQVQLDADRDKLSQTIKAFSLLEPFKSVLFANSVMYNDDPKLLCARDMLWEKSTHGINPHNIGMYESIPETAEELMEYIASTSIFCTERGDKYLFFYPIPFSKYSELSEIEGEYYSNGEYHKEIFTPRPEDIDHLRTYKFIDLTARGTIEYRSVCTQPLSEALSPAAFQIGLLECLSELCDILENDTVLYHHGFTAGELRRLMNMDTFPDFVDVDRLRETLLKLVHISQMGLKKRGYGEEVYLKPIFRRAGELLSPAREMVRKLNAGTAMSEIVRQYAII